MCFVFPFSSISVLTTLYPGIDSEGLAPSLDGSKSVSLPSFSITTYLVSGRTVGIYLAVTGVPFVSTRLTVTPAAFPTKFGSGVNVTFPFSSIVYVPSFGTFFVVVPSSNFGFTASSISTGTSFPLSVTFPPVNVGVPS